MRKFFFYLYAIITAPGVVAHELSHAFFCVFAGVKIHRINLFRFGRTAGFVVHDEPNKMLPAFLISFGPLLINSLLALLLFSQITKLGYEDWRAFACLWLGVALGLHSIPSTGDARSLMLMTNRRVWRNPFALVVYPFVLLLYILNWLKRLHIDIIYVALLLWLGAMYLK